ncbi:heavy metal translocating P-type ATPase [Nevskia soli]|uniref:heavy metal translocating P-type ATPase n=1 Tax=Nevskia soli TaxID=418856 RepID=UPI0004A6D54B|nr:heavy metal translocating P-type ATPase [Nevskia soli]
MSTPAKYRPASAQPSCCHGGQDHGPGEAVPAPTVKDPVCGMNVEPAKAPTFEHAGTAWYFCSNRCRDRFAAEPAKYLAAAPGPVAAQGMADTRTYTCPMHPEVRQNGPGTCPKCGMALEPEAPSLDEGPDPELAVMRRKLILSLLLSVPVFLAAMSEMLPGGGLAALLGMGTVAWGEALLATPVVWWLGGFIFVRGVDSLRHRSPNMWTLIALGTGAAWIYSALALVFPAALPAAFAGAHGMPPLYFEAAAVITTLVILGQVLEAAARSRTSAAIRALLRLTPKVAHRLRDGVESDVPLEQVAAGDVLRVRPGENVPVDGVVLEGDSHVDEAMLTGEPAPQRKTRDARLTAGTVNGQGALVLRAERVGDETLLAQIVQLVAQAGRSRAPAQRLADKVAAWFVPAVVACAVLAAAAWWFYGPAPAGAHALLAAVSVLIIACPCALGLATPISVMVGVGRGAHAGVLIRDAAALERLQQVDTLVIDKTGTLTLGKPALQTIAASEGFSDDEVLQFAAAVEAASEHPLARAIVDAAKARALGSLAVADFGADPGLGAWAQVGPRKVCVGNAALMQREGVELGLLAARIDSLQAAAQTVVLVAVAGRAAGVLGLADSIKPGAATALAELHALGLRVVMASGDSRGAAQAVARTLGLDDVRAGLLPQDKAALVRELQAQGRVVAMAGDGINDAPALASADVGIAMGGGTDVAMQSAAVTLVKGELAGIARGIRLSRASVRNIRQNLFFAFAYNVLGVPIAAGVLYPWLGLLLSPMLASLAMSLSSVCVIGNALRLRSAQLDG